MRLDAQVPEFTPDPDRAWWCACLRYLRDGLSPDEADSPATRALTRLYDTLISGASGIPAHMRFVFSPTAADPRPALSWREEPRVLQDISARRHLGHLSNTYGLDSTQRRAVWETQSACDGDAVAVSGPPGTGKTSLLRGFVASEIVHAALRGGPPAVIVATSHTHQAIRNIIDALSIDAGGGFAQRWLPDAPGLAWSSRRGQADRPAVSDVPILARVPWAPFWAPQGAAVGLHGVMAHLHPDAESRRLEYLAHYEAARRRDPQSGLPAAADVASACAALQTRLRALAEGQGAGSLPTAVALCRAIYEAAVVERDAGRADSLIADLRACLGGSAPDALAHVVRELLPVARVIIGTPVPSHALLITLRERLESILDRTVRVRMAWLALHYWEARWLLEDAPVRCARDALMRAAMLAPVFVTTTHSAPLLLDPDDAGEGVPVVDWLVVEEAGQVPPQFVAGLMHCARRVLAIGDAEQLAPVGVPSRVVDKALREREPLFQQAPLPRHLRVSSACALHMVLHASRISEMTPGGPVKGVFLRHHYRCRRTIIEFCNQLVYRHGRRLIPAVEDDARICPLPPMGYATLAQGRSERMRDSLINSVEAEAVVDWLIDHREALEAHYGQPLANCVAIVTPFSAQARLLRNLLTARIGTEAVDPMTIGTVHALQGAERAIVLFSAVVAPGASNGTGFLDLSPALLNVAVSRARDSFVAFFHPNALPMDRGGDTPSEILGRYLAEAGWRIRPRRAVLVDASVDHVALQRALGGDEAVFVVSHLEPGTEVPMRQQMPILAWLAGGQRNWDQFTVLVEDSPEGEALGWSWVRSLRGSGAVLPVDRVSVGRLPPLATYEAYVDAVEKARAPGAGRFDLARVKAGLFITQWLKSRVTPIPSLSLDAAAVLSAMAQAQCEAPRTRVEIRDSSTGQPLYLRAGRTALDPIWTGTRAEAQALVKRMRLPPAPRARWIQIGGIAAAARPVTWIQTSPRARIGGISVLHRQARHRMDPATPETTHG